VRTAALVAADRVEALSVTVASVQPFGTLVYICSKKRRALLNKRDGCQISWEE